MLAQKPTHFFLCAGAAEGMTPLNAFDNALMKAGVGNLNLIRLSSILPPRTKLSGPRKFEPGDYLPIAYGATGSSEKGEHISAGVAAAIPVDATLNGVIMEFSGTCSAKEAEETVRGMAAEAMRVRGYDVKEILSIAAEHVTETHGAVFAGVVLYPESAAR